MATIKTTLLKLRSTITTVKTAVHALLPVTLVGHNIPVQPSLARMFVRGSLSTLIIHLTRLGVRIVTFRTRADEVVQRFGTQNVLSC